ncbi:MAG: hypothetical protein HY902_02610 [Deltaproteobacteria bacterium]|nr:hypothetical protein [Deltaproteobacteria bacterium]
MISSFHTRTRTKGALAAAWLALALTAAAPVRAAEPTDPALAEATAVADQAFKDFDAKRFRQAAQGFLKAYQLSGGRYPKQLRNAAKALYAGGFLEECLETWKALAAAPEADAEMLAEAQAQILQVRSQLAGQFQQQAEAAHKAKRHAAAAELYAHGFAASGGARTDLLMSAAAAYESAGQLDDAHLSWQMVAQALAGQPEPQRAANAAVTRVTGRLRKLPGAEPAYAARQAEQWAEAASLLLKLYDRDHERAHLRLAATALETAGRPDEAETAWVRYQEVARSAPLAATHAQVHLDGLHIQRLESDARAAAAAGRHAVAAEKWLALFEMSKNQRFAALREAAAEFEAAGEFERARQWWGRLAASDAAPAALRQEAKAHLSAAPAKVVATPPAKVDGPVAPATPAVRATVPAATCRWCRYAWIGAGVGAVAGAVLVGVARSDQSDLATATQTTDASGRITGVSLDEASSRQSRNNLLNGLGFGLVGAAVAAGTAGAVWTWLLPDAPALHAAVAPSEGGAVVLVGGRWR